jgi:hypothetical protein
MYEYVQDYLLGDGYRYVLGLHDCIHMYMVMYWWCAKCMQCRLVLFVLGYGWKRLDFDSTTPNAVCLSRRTV